MKKFTTILVAIVLLLGLAYYQKPIVATAYEWSHFIIGGLSGSDGVPIKVDADGKIYANFDDDITMNANLQFQSLIYAHGRYGGVSTIVSTVTPLSASNLAFGYIYLEEGSPGLHRLDDGEIGQEITLQFLGTPAYTIGDNPMTRTGWDTITFNSVNDWITLSWIDDTYGWIITANGGCAITY